MQVDLWVLAIIGSIVVACITIAINSTLKAVESSHSLKSANDEIARLGKKIDSLQDEIKKSSNQNRFSDFSALSGSHINNLTFDQKTGTWEGKDSLRYCATCKVQDKISPLQVIKQGWFCNVCKTSFYDHEKHSMYAGSNSRIIG